MDKESLVTQTRPSRSEWGSANRDNKIDKRIGITPEPVPISKILFPLRTLAKSANKNGSIEKR